MALLFLSEALIKPEISLSTMTAVRSYLISPLSVFIANLACVLPLPALPPGATGTGLQKFAAPGVRGCC